MSTTQDSVMRGGTASMGNGSPGQGPKAQKKFILKKNKYQTIPKQNLNTGTNKPRNTNDNKLGSTRKYGNYPDHVNDQDNSLNQTTPKQNLNTGTNKPRNTNADKFYSKIWKLSRSR